MFDVPRKPSAILDGGLLTNRLGAGELKPWQAYVFALLVTAATFGLRLALDSRLGGQPTLVIFTLPIMLSAYVGGLRAGLLATVLSYFAASYYLLPPVHSFRVVSGVEGWQQFFVVTAGVFISTLNEALHRARHRVNLTTHEHQQAREQLRQSEKRLRESEARTRMLIKSSDTGLWDWNLVTNEVFFSAEWKSQLGYTDAELPSRFEEWQSRLHPDDREPTLAAVQDYREGRRGDYEVDFRLRHKDGSWRWIFARATMTRDVTGQPAHMMGGHIDITARKQAEEALRESEERFSGAFEHAPIGVALVAPDGRWLKVNRALCDVVGYSEAELLARTFQDITYPKDLEKDLENVRRMIAGEIRTYEMEKRYIHARGHLVTVLLNVSLVRDGHGQPLYFIAQIQNISERKLAEAELDKSHRDLLEASRLAGMAEVATGVLHNVGNVLNSVNVAASCVGDTLRKSRAANLSKVADLLRDHESDLGSFLTENPKGKQIPVYLAQLAEHLAAEQSSALKELAGLQKNIEHIKDIVSMQQGFAKISGARETLSVIDLVEDALKMNSSALARHDIVVTKDFHMVPPITVEKHKVLQILVNLVRNAKQACDESNPPVKRLNLRVSNGGDRVRIAVTDNGIGILPENLTRIFAHGFTTKPTGHGFGLHSGALAAKELGGALTVQSDGFALGSTFTLELPLNN